MSRILLGNFNIGTQGENSAAVYGISILCVNAGVSVLAARYINIGAVEFCLPVGIYAVVEGFDVKGSAVENQILTYFAFGADAVSRRGDAVISFFENNLLINCADSLLVSAGNI